MNPFADTLAFLTRNEWPIYVSGCCYWAASASLCASLQDPSAHGPPCVDVGRPSFHRRLMVDKRYGSCRQPIRIVLTACRAGCIIGSEKWCSTRPSASKAGSSKRSSDLTSMSSRRRYITEVIIAVSLLLGVCTRLGGVLGALMALNLWLGLYRASYEWPWAYFFLIMLQTTFVSLHAGRSLGLDAILARRQQAQPRPEGAAACVLAYLT